MKAIGMKSVVIVAATLLATVTLSACGSDKSNSASDHNAQDMSFAANMIPHHGQAIEMAKVAVTQAKSDQVKALAARIQEAQQPEIDKMNGWLRGWGEKEVDPSMSTSGHMGHDMSMQGMMSDDDMMKLHSESGSAFDRMFLQMMIQHHNGAIEMAKTEMSTGKYADAKSMASSIATSQQSEVTEMENLLKNV